MKYLIKFRDGSYFNSLKSDLGVSKSAAKRFDTKELAEKVMRDNVWILFNGGMVVRVEK